MIWESSYWKLDLIKDADILLNWSKKKQSDRQYVLFEKKIFLAAYSIRKLIEAEKIGSDFPMWNLSVHRFQKKTARKIDYMNSHRVDEFYDFESLDKCSMNIIMLCNILVHSFIFRLNSKKLGSVTSFLFNSDGCKENFLYELDLEKFINLLKWVGHSEVIKECSVRDSREPSGFKITREYCFDDCIPRKGLPLKTKLMFQSERIKRDLGLMSMQQLMDLDI